MITPLWSRCEAMDDRRDVGLLLNGMWHRGREPSPQDEMVLGHEFVGRDKKALTMSPLLWGCRGVGGTGMRRRSITSPLSGILGEN